MKNIEAHRLKNNSEYAAKLWVQERQNHGLTGWKLVIKDTGDKAGICNYSEKTIYLSSLLFRGYNCNYEKVKKILMHEISHALTPGHNHDTVWKGVCRELGGDSRLSTTMVKPGMNWVLYCTRCKQRHEYLDKPSIHGKVCGRCYGPFKIKYIK